MRRTSVLLCGLLSFSLAATAISQTFPRFPADAIWNQDVSAQSIDANSAACVQGYFLTSP
jgi:hypothetical protein